MNNESTRRRRLQRHITPDKKLLRPVGTAIADFDMIRDGDRILLGVSGGKDSYTLLDILMNLRLNAPIDFDLLARLDPGTGKVIGPSIYSEMVWNARQLRARRPTGQSSAKTS